MKVSIMGTGYVGLVTGACLAEMGHDVVCVDVDADKVDAINRGEPPIFELGLEDLLRRNIGGRLSATLDARAAVLSSDVTFIAVGTPFDGHRIDLRYIEESARTIGRTLADKDEYHVVVVKSTVVPGTTDSVVLPILEAESGRRAGVDFGVGMNPEFLTEGEAVSDFMNPDRIICGGIDSDTHEVLESLYAPFPDVPSIRTNNSTAEMIKYASNALLATLISFSNELANLGAALGGIDIVEVMDGLHASRYLTTALEGGQTVVPPITSFLMAGCGFGGSCLPKDVSSLVARARDAGVPMPLHEAVLSTNARQPEQVFELLAKHFDSLSGVPVTVLGLSFRPDTNDMRESPAIPIISGLWDRGAQVRAYDPAAADEARRLLAGLEVSDTLEEALRGAEAVVLVTRWEEFARVPDLLAQWGEKPVFVDGRRMLDKTSVEIYEGIGL